MSEPKREQLHIVWRDSSGFPVNTQEATDADLTAIGYYRLEGIDVEALRRQVKWAEDGGLKGSFVDLARQVLAALDGEEA